MSTNGIPGHFPSPSLPCTPVRRPRGRPRKYPPKPAAIACSEGGDEVEQANINFSNMCVERVEPRDETPVPQQKVKCRKCDFQYRQALRAEFYDCIASAIGVPIDTEGPVYQQSRKNALVRLYDYGRSSAGSTATTTTTTAQNSDIDEHQSLHLSHSKISKEAISHHMHSNPFLNAKLHTSIKRLLYEGFTQQFSGSPSSSSRRMPASSVDLRTGSPYYGEPMLVSESVSHPHPVYPPQGIDFAATVLLSSNGHAEQLYNDVCSSFTEGLSFPSKLHAENSASSSATSASSASESSSFSPGSSFVSPLSFDAPERQLSTPSYSCQPTFECSYTCRCSCKNTPVEEHKCLDSSMDLEVASDCPEDSINSVSGSTQPYVQPVEVKAEADESVEASDAPSSTAVRKRRERKVESLPLRSGAMCVYVKQDEVWFTQFSEGQAEQPKNNHGNSAYTDFVARNNMSEDMRGQDSDECVQEVRNSEGVVVGTLKSRVFKVNFLEHEVANKQGIQNAKTRAKRRAMRYLKNCNQVAAGDDCSDSSGKW
eukprot:GHVQ01015868.1.p1 GENE.GHVQ01015868.1~~GHVQ01015868.1.p1  ORF type:complete len:540 (+),score=57.76 GHVQ01015868.1:162-1781(+)